MVRVALSGSHCTGKTTLGKSLVESYSSQYDVFFHTNMARKLIDQGYPMNMEATDETYIKYVLMQTEVERMNSQCEIFISDRTLLDPLAYAIVNRTYVNSSVSEKIIDELRHRWNEEKSLYRLFFFNLIEFPMERDGVRPDDEKYRLLVQEEMLKILKASDVRYEILTGNAEKRTGYAKSCIDTLLLENR